MTRRSRILVSTSLALVLAAGILAAAWLGGRGDSESTARVVREDFRKSIEAPGKLEAELNYEIGPPSARGYWNYDLTWMIPEGRQVEQGDVVARFDTTQLDDSLRDHRARLETTVQEKEKEQRNLEVSLKQLRLDLVKAQGELKVVDLDLSVPEGLVSDIEIAEMRLRKTLADRRVTFLREKTEFEQALVKAKLEVLDVKRRFSEDKIAYLESVKEKFSVQAPVSGMVVYVAKRNGDRWEVGESVWMLAKILEVADVSTLRVEANLLEVDAARVAPGQRAEISVDAIPGLTIDSEIVEIGKIVHERSLQDRSKVFDAILPLGAGNDEQLRPGMGVRVSIETRLLRDQLTIPLDAVRLGKNGAYVTVIGSGGASSERQVSLGERNQERVVVLAGLEENETVRRSLGAASG